MYYPEEIVEEVRQKNDIVDVISGYVRLKKQGGSYFGLCPFHNEKSPSFSVSGYKQMYYCFGCGKGGNVFTFIRDYENYSYPEAIKFLAERAGVNLPEMEYTEEMKKKADKRNSLLEINKAAATYFYKCLRAKPGELGLKYFTDRRLTSDTMKSFGLGYSLQYSDDLVKYLRNNGFTDDLIKESGLAVFNEKYGFNDKFINRVMFPIQDMNNKVIGFGGRVLGDAKPKYLNSPETMIFEKKRNLYGMNVARTSRKGYVILCEGYMDVISMHQAGFKEAVASLGTAFTPEQAMLIKRYVKDVYLAYDSDGAGTNAALRAIGILKDTGLNGRVINLKPYKDPDEFIKNLGAEELTKRIENAENGFMFSIRILRESTDINDPASKTQFHNEIANRLCTFEEELERENYLDAVVTEYGINKDSLKKRIAEVAARGVTSSYVAPKSTVVAKESKEDGKLKSQRYLLTWIVEEPKIYPKIKQYISPQDFTDEQYKAIAARLFEDIEKGTINPAAIINMFEDVEKQQRAAEVFNSNIEAIETPEQRSQALRDVVVAVKKSSFEHYSLLMGEDEDALSKVIESKRKLEELMRMPIVID